MESLLRRFAEARKSRQASRSALIKTALQSKEQRSAELRSQAERLNQELSQAHQQRLLNNHNRLVLSNLHQQSRRAESLSRSQAIDGQLTNQQQTRLTYAEQDQHHRQAEYCQRAREVQRFLAERNIHRLAESLTDRQLRQRDRQSRCSNLQQQLRQIKLHRLHSSELAKHSRHDHYRQLATNTQELLTKLKGDRHAFATALRQDLRTFRQQLAQIVGTTPAPLPKAEPKEIKMLVSAIPTTAQQFIQQYIAQLQGQPSLAQVISDRDLVRDILAQGANQLKIDPSDILNTLLRLATT